ncbi:hypothetical protein NEA10_12710 [Phormidium yuhuli AB48]|uniref:Uncharacterized protein n=1 Tax=Phormidium yuhuli AB48 TaxID=2940671 RepID=A0ABY5ALD4_9CYAN|nr:hypothetical protein [Phormidium yuhuli]USR89738.1 hypothetical protein NEA10_12710 [Phormidium yuhuli AB48]
MDTTQERKLASYLAVGEKSVEFSMSLSLRLKRYLSGSVDLLFDVLHQIERNLDTP